MSGPKPTTTTCRSYVPVSELPKPVQAAVTVAIAGAVGSSDREVDRTIGPNDATVCTAPDGTVTYEFDHSTIDENWFSPDIMTSYEQTLRCDGDGYCASSQVTEKEYRQVTCDGTFQGTGWTRNYTSRFGPLPKKP